MIICQLRESTIRSILASSKMAEGCRANSCRRWVSPLATTVNRELLVIQLFRIGSESDKTIPYQKLYMLTYKNNLFVFLTICLSMATKKAKILSASYCQEMTSQLSTVSHFDTFSPDSMKDEEVDWFFFKSAQYLMLNKGKLVRKATVIPQKWLRCLIYFRPFLQKVSLPTSQPE